MALVQSSTRAHLTSGNGGKKKGNQPPPMTRMIQLNLSQEADIEEMYTQIPEMRFGMEATRGWAFCHPPEVKWPAMGTVAGPEFQYVLQKYYTVFRWECYVRGKKKFGIVPYKMRWIRDHWVPVVPMLGTGTIWQYFDVDNECMVYLWFWNQRPGETEADPEMRFYVPYPPDINGNFTSPAVSGLRGWKMAKIMSLSGTRAAFHGSHMPQFLIHSPPKGRPGDEKVEIAFGDAEELQLDRDRHNRTLEKGQMSRNALRAGLDQARAANTGAEASIRAAHISPVLNSESIGEREEREGNGVLDRLIELDDHWTLAPSAPPVLVVDPLEYERRIGQIVSSLVDLPLSMVIEQHAQHAGNFDAQIAFARDRMKSVIYDMNQFLTDVILDAERHHLHKIYVDAARWKMHQANRPLTEEELLDIHSSVHGLVVDQQCTPLVTFESLVQVWELGLMEQQTLAEQAFHLHGLPKSALKAKHSFLHFVSFFFPLSYTPPPLGYKTQEDTRTRNGPTKIGPDNGQDAG